MREGERKRKERKRKKEKQNASLHTSPIELHFN
jgi:hypothetical protein